jgi:hypothetical protein
MRRDSDWLKLMSALELKPPSGPPNIVELRNAVVDAIVARVTTADLPELCDHYGLPQHDPTMPTGSKREYVRERIRGYSLAQIVGVATRVVEDYGDEQLDALIRRLSPHSATGEFRNLIFAANGPKPRIVLRDAVSNIIEIIENEQYCLVYDRPLTAQGLTWRELVAWWATRPGADGDERRNAQRLYQRLAASLASTPERSLFRAYCTRYGTEGGFDLPALVPQVYLHYDPYTRQMLAPQAGELPRQRMDFLLLLPHSQRVVLEVDGMHHYANGQRADPGRYSAMVARTANSDWLATRSTVLGDRSLVDMTQPPCSRNSSTSCSNGTTLRNQVSLTSRHSSEVSAGAAYHLLLGIDPTEVSIV